MRILAVSDEVSTTLYRANREEITGTVEILLSCGDLPYDYLEYIVTQARVRHAFFVHGNHDEPQELFNGRVLKAPGGWINLDRRSLYVKEHDLLIAGLEGSILYRRHAGYQYTESEMARHALRLVPQLLLNRVFHRRYLDVLVTHAPPKGIHDTPQGAHQGFGTFLRLMDRFRPRLLIHGHNHRYGMGAWHTRYQRTEVVNVHPYCMLNLDQRKKRVTFSCSRHH